MGDCPVNANFCTKEVKTMQGDTQKVEAGAEANPKGSIIITPEAVIFTGNFTMYAPKIILQ